MPPAQGLTWSVTSQQETVDRGPDGSLVNGYKINFTTPSGVSGSIFVPRTAYNAANVKALLRAHISELEAVSSSTAP